MAEEKNIKTRIIHKHDTEANWKLATNFTPKQGEIIVYDKDNNYEYERFKIGDGVTNVNNLPFGHVPSNWNETDADRATYIQNKPKIYAADENKQYPLENFNNESSIVIGDNYWSEYDDDYGYQAGGSNNIYLNAKRNIVVNAPLVASDNENPDSGLNFDGGILDLASNSMGSSRLFGGYALNLSASDYLVLEGGSISLSTGDATLNGNSIVTTNLLPQPNWKTTDPANRNYIFNKPDITQTDNIMKIGSGDHGYIEVVSGAQTDSPSSITFKTMQSDQSGETPVADSVINFEGQRTCIGTNSIDIGLSYATYDLEFHSRKYDIYLYQPDDNNTRSLTYEIKDLNPDSGTPIYDPFLTGGALNIEFSEYLSIESNNLTIQGEDITPQSFVPRYNEGDIDEFRVLTTAGWKYLTGIGPGARYGECDGAYIKVETNNNVTLCGSSERKWVGEEEIFYGSDINIRTYETGSIYLNSGINGIYLNGKTYINDQLLDLEKIAIPEYTEADEGKVLQIVNGVPTWVGLSTTADIDAIINKEVTE